MIRPTGAPPKVWFFTPQRKAQISPTSRLLTARSIHGGLLRQDRNLHMVKRERWTEDDLDALASEEPDTFDRKSGQLVRNDAGFRNSLAKALSAFANSGGGSLVLGVADDGTIDGVGDPLVGRTSARDWIEQVAPHLVDYPLSDFRVHTVVKRDDGTSRIPPGKAVIVIDVGDSALAPHQSSRDQVYYHRQGGRSVPARHFYLELLRQRLTNPTLVFRLASLAPVFFEEHDDGLFLVLEQKFDIENTGRVSANNWRLHICEVATQEGRGKDFYYSKFPVKHRPRASGIPLDRAILPGCFANEVRTVGFQLRPATPTQAALRSEILSLLGGTTLSYRLATETSPGELTPVTLAAVLDPDALVTVAYDQCPLFFREGRRPL